MRIRYWPAIIGGFIVALFASVSVGSNSETFWVGFAQAFGFSVLCVAAVIGGLVLVNRRLLRP